MKKIIFGISSLLLLIIACSKDRSILLAEPEPVEKTIKDKIFVASKANTFDKWAAKPQKISIKSMNELPFKCKDGTIINFIPSDFLLSNGMSPSFPIDLEILELLTPKDMIIHQKPTVSYNRMLTTGGEIFVKAYKDGKELALNPYHRLSIKVPVKGQVDPKMGLFYGDELQESGGQVNWVASDSIRTPIDTVELNRKEYPRGLFPGKSDYEIFPKRLGWINCDKFINYQVPLTTIQFSSEFPELKLISIFLYFPELKSLIKVYDGISLKVPVGSLMKVIAISTTDKGEVYAFLQDVTVENNQKVKITLGETTEQGFLDYLQTLN